MSLWGPEFDISTKEKTKKVLNKVKTVKEAKPKNILKSKTIDFESKLSYIKSEVYRILGKYAENTEVIYSYDRFKEYIDESIKNGIISIDTETNNSLDPITCQIMGLCIYTPNQKQAYIPVNHIDTETKERLQEQITEEQIKEQLDRLSDTKIIMHNGKFDYQVIKCTCNCELKIYWDTMIASKVLNETESAKLKDQYVLHVDSTQEKYSIDHLFDKVLYSELPPDLFALYAATDSFITYRLFEYQKACLEDEPNKKLFELFKSIEMPLVEVVANMELTGVCLDLEYGKRLSEKYHKKYEELDKKINSELKKYDSTIASWRSTFEANQRPKANNSIGQGKTKNEQLSNPINLSSSAQLAIFLYDILKIEPVDKKSPRGTGEDILKKIDLPLCKLILEQRSLLKLINTYIDKLPECLSKKDNRLHAHFNQYGADTGRFSSSDPNLQNIPSHNNEIRMMFTATEGYTLIGSDYSQQEPRLLSQYSQDENMINAYKEGKDLYAMIASKVYHNQYEDNKEFRPDGSINPEGKKRRTSVKSLLLGIMYGMGTSSIAETLKCSMQEAIDIKEGFFKEFPKVEQWINETEKNAEKNGYVEDIWGRRRRLPDIKLSPYEIIINNESRYFNPLLSTKGQKNSENLEIKTKYLSKLQSCRNRAEIEQIKNLALADNIKIMDNKGFIAQAKRQCVNARIQGGAASMSKRAMIAVYKDQHLRDIGFRLLIAVHDELIGECPVEYKEEAKKRLSHLMIKAALPDVVVPMKCDASDFKSWYEDVCHAEIRKEYEKLKGQDPSHAIDNLMKSRSEYTREQLQEIIS